MMEQLVTLLRSAAAASEDDGNEDRAPPGSPADRYRQYSDGPWFRTQLTISVITGLSALLAFCLLRRRFKAFFAPRQLLRGFTAHETHLAGEESFLGWTWPTLRVSELAVLQLVGLDATVLLSFFKLGFQLFAVLSFLACSLLMPLNWREIGTIDGVPQTKPHTPDPDRQGLFKSHDPVMQGTDLLLTSHLIFTAVFTLITLLFLNRTYKNFVRQRQLFALDVAHSIPARTVLVQNVPLHLQQDRVLGEYFQKLNLDVESVNVVRQVGRLTDLLQERTQKLRTLESAWAKYLGNPTKLHLYDRQAEESEIINGGGSAEPTASQAAAAAETSAAPAEPSPPVRFPTEKLVVPGKKRPTLRPRWFGKSVDALDFYTDEYRRANEAVVLARKGRFRPTATAFVTFETQAAAQIAAQTAHFPQPDQMLTSLAPEPRDVHWSNIVLSSSSVWLRNAVVLALTVMTLLFWGAPVSQIARLLSYDTIAHASPALARLIERFPFVQGLIQTSLPSLALIGFNALLPYLLEGYSIFQGLQAKSWIEYSLLKKYYLFLVVNVLFIVVSVSTVTLARDLAGEPLKIMEKLATTLPAARNFYVAYVMLQGLGIMPLQLLGLGPIISTFIFRLFCSTPRDHAELNAPPVLNLGVVYPQALLVFVIGLTYSIVKPLILPFTAIYFAMSYLVYKYRLLNVYHRPFESRGQAWPIAFNRIAVGLLIFQLFMTGIFTVRGAFSLSTLMALVMATSAWVCWRLHRRYRRLSRFVNLQQACEAERDVNGPEDVQKLRRGHPVTFSQTRLSQGRYNQRDDSLYVVADDPRTDYAQPPLSDVFVGILNTGRRRYGHPALSGQLPLPWLPISTSPTVKSPGVVINIRRRWSIVKGGARRLAQYPPPSGRQAQREAEAWQANTLDIERQEANNGRVHGDFGVVPMGDDDEEEEITEGEEEQDTKYATYFVKSGGKGPAGGAAWDQESRSSSVQPQQPSASTSTAS